MFAIKTEIHVDIKAILQDICNNSRLPFHQEATHALIKIAALCFNLSIQQIMKKFLQGKSAQGVFASEDLSLIVRSLF